MESKVTQKLLILEHLKSNGYITSMEAFESYGVTRLSSIIYTLRHEGYNIESVYMTTTNRYGKQTRFASYVLEEDIGNGNTEFSD